MALHSSTRRPRAQAAKKASDVGSARAANAVFLAYLAVALPVLLALGSHRWYTADEWELLSGRRPSVLGDWFRPANGHWSTIPMASYQLLFTLFGLRTYVPYQAVVVVLHLVLAALIRVVMRRAGVRPWTATVVASIFVLFGSGSENIFLAIQVSQLGSVVLGFTQVILADHDGDLNRRDWLGLLAGAIGLMASGMGPIMIIAVGIATALRRGWRSTLFHVGPLVAMYLVWRQVESGPIKSQSSTLVKIPVAFSWVRVGTTGLFSAVGQYRVVAILLACVLVVGLVLAWLPLSLDRFRASQSAPVALLVVAFALFAVVSTQRFFLGSQFARSSRYLDTSTACLLPALGVAADALLRRWKLLTPIALVLFAAGIPGNVRMLHSSDQADKANKAFVLGVAASPLMERLPRDVHPDPNRFVGMGSLTVGWLQDAKRAGRIPGPPHVGSALQDKITMRLSVAQSSGPVPARLVCQKFNAPFEVTMHSGDTLGLSGPVALTLLRDGRAVSVPIVYSEDFEAGRLLTAEVPVIRLRLGPTKPGRAFGLCD
jgi:hypothetical protein